MNTYEFISDQLVKERFYLKIKHLFKCQHKHVECVLYEDSCMRGPLASMGREKLSHIISGQKEFKLQKPITPFFVDSLVLPYRYEETCKKCGHLIHRF